MCVRVFMSMCVCMYVYLCVYIIIIFLADTLHILKVLYHFNVYVNITLRTFKLFSLCKNNGFESFLMYCFMSF